MLVTYMVLYGRGRDQVIRRAEWPGSISAVARCTRPPAQAKINVALYRLAQGNRSQVKGLGNGVAELKVDFGPGYRIYFGQDGEALVILLAGGAKKRQSEDILTAKARWAEYKARKTHRK